MSNWEVRFSNSRQLPYFYEASSGTSSWERPDAVPEDQLALLPGAHLLSPGAGGGAPGSGNAGADGKVRASHLLVKSRESRRPSSWKEPNITRSIEEAEKILRQHQSTLGAQPTTEQFAALASGNSDCQSASKGGDLGFFSRGQMQKPFEDAAFGLSVGQMSDVMKTDSGLHLILRTA